MDTFRHYEEALRSLESVRQSWSTRLHATDQIAKAMEAIRADISVRDPSIDAIVKQMKPALSQMESWKRAKLSAHERIAFSVNGAIAADLHSCFRNLAAPYKQITDMLATQQASWTAAIRKSAAFRISEVVQGSLVAQRTGLQHLFALPNLKAVFSQHAKLASLVMRPQNLFADYMKRTSEELQAARSKTVASALRASASLTGAQLVDSDVLLAKAVRDAEISETDVSEFADTPLAIPDVQKREILEAGIIIPEGDIATAEAQSEAAQISFLARRVLDLVHECNEAAQIAIEEVIFKPTNRILAVYARMPWLLAQDRSTLADAVDCLFWLLYEGAGDDNLRFIDVEKGLFDTDECDAVFDIKFLRNKWLRHDPDHGKDVKIRKSWEDVRGVLAKVGLGHMPVAAADFMQIQRRLLEQVGGFLDELRRRLNAIARERNK